MKTFAISALLCLFLLSYTAQASQVSNSDSDALVSDIDTLCSRVKMKRISAWSQPVYRTDRWYRLMVRADAGDSKAFCDIAHLMKRYRSQTSCEKSFIDEIEGRCTK